MTWQTCPACGGKFDDEEIEGYGMSGCVIGECLACENCCRCDPDSAGIPAERNSDVEPKSMTLTADDLVPK